MESGHESYASVENGENVEITKENLPESSSDSLLDHLCYCKNSNQLKWNSNSDNLADFLCLQLNTSKDSIKISSNGSCSVFKLPSATFNFYHNTKTLQVQGRESSSLKESLINLTSTRSAKNVKPKETEAESQAEFVILEETTVDEPSSTSPKNDAIKQTTITVENSSDSEIDSEESDSEESDDEDQNEVLTEIAKVWDAIKDIKQIISSKDKIKTAEQVELEQSKNRILQLEHENRSLLEVIRLMSSQNSYLPQFWKSPIVIPNERNERAQGNASRVNYDDNTTNDNGTNEQLKTTKKKKKKTSKQKTTSTESQNSPSPKDAQPEASPKKSKPTVVIAGDSIVKYINGWKVCRNHSTTYVKSFSGATVNDMSHYIKPSVERKPDEIILHVGTNDIKSKEARKIAEKVVDLGREIQDESPDTKASAELAD